MTLLPSSVHTKIWYEQKIEETLKKKRENKKPKQKKSRIWIFTSVICDMVRSKRKPTSAEEMKRHLIEETEQNRKNQNERGNNKQEKNKQTNIFIFIV